jgi:hypothetical protein
VGLVEKRVLLVLLLISLGTFVLFAFPNATGARDTSMISLFEPDEFAQYSYLTKMLDFERGDFKHSLYNFVVYRHYYYGYPFYLGSGLTLLPVRLLAGLNAKNTEVPLLLLRQFLSVLPMLTALLIFTYLQTRFRSFGPTIFTFVLLLVIPGVVRNSMWWHPDSLAMLFIALTFFFLDRDALKFGRDFLLAAAACGLATGTKVLGLFFVLAIPVYLLLGLRNRGLSWKGAVLKGAQFLGIMALAIVVSNPFLLIPSELKEMLRIQSGQAAAMAAGWILYYTKGPASWGPVVTQWYSGPLFLALAVLLLVITPFRSIARRTLYIMIAGWAVPLSMYLLFFAAVKPSHFLLPVFIPLASCVAASFDGLVARDWSPRNRVGTALLVLGFAIGAYQIAWSSRTDLGLYREVLAREQTSPALVFYRALKEDYLTAIPEEESLLIYRDVRTYFPQSRGRRVLSFFNTTNYQIIGKMNPDLIIFWRQRILDYTTGTAASNAIDPGTFNEVNRLFADVRAGSLTGYRLMLQDGASLAFIRDDLYRKYFTP